MTQQNVSLGVFGPLSVHLHRLTLIHALPLLLSIFICPSFTLALHCYPFLPICVSFHLHSPIFSLSLSPAHVVLLSIPLYSLPPFLSSLAHIWFLSLDLCVFGVTQSSLGLPAHTRVYIHTHAHVYTHRCSMCGCVCFLQTGIERHRVGESAG